MSKPQAATGEKSLIRRRIIKLRKEQGLSQLDLARELQLAGYDMDKNVITRIERNKRYVSDFELKAFSEIFQVSYEYLLDGDGEEEEENMPERDDVVETESPKKQHS